MPYCKRCGSWANYASSCKACNRLDKMETAQGNHKCDRCGVTIPSWEEWCTKCWEFFRFEQDYERIAPQLWAREGWPTASKGRPKGRGRSTPTASPQTTWPPSTSPPPTLTLGPTYSGRWSGGWSWRKPQWQPKVDHNSGSQWNSTSADDGERQVDQYCWTPPVSPEGNADAGGGGGGHWADATPYPHHRGGNEEERLQQAHLETLQWAKVRGEERRQAEEAERIANEALKRAEEELAKATTAREAKSSSASAKPTRVRPRPPQEPPPDGTSASAAQGPPAKSGRSVREPERPKPGEW